MTIHRMSAEEAALHLPGLCALLKDSVDGGASVGYLPPLGEDEATAYWQGIVADVDQGRRLLFVAMEDSALLGTVQLTLEGRPNGSHRAEVNKLLVHSSARRRGVATALMAAVEDAARAEARTLLVLDTVLGDNAERLYRRIGFQTAGVIPRYARNGAGGFDPTVYMYKDLLETGAGASQPGAAMA